MKENKTVRKINMGETYVDAKDGQQYVHMNGSIWAVVNQLGQVIEMYRAKWIALGNVR